MALATAMISLYQTPEEERSRVARAMAKHVGVHFSLKAMADEVLQGYRDAAAVAARRTDRETTFLRGIL